MRGEVVEPPGQRASASIGTVIDARRAGAAGERRRQQRRRAVGERQRQRAARRERLRVREHGDVGGAEPRRDVVVGDPAGERGRRRRTPTRSVGGEARARRVIRGCSPPATTTWTAGPVQRARVEDDLDALVRRDEAEAEHDEALVETEAPAGVAARRAA